MAKKPVYLDDLDKRRLSPYTQTLQTELNRILHVLIERGRLVKVRKKVTIDVSVIAAFVLVRPVISIPLLIRDIEACGYESKLDVDWKTRFPTGIYGYNDKYIVSLDMRLNTVLLTVK